MQTTQDNILDVTTLEPRLKHPTIFRMFDDLQGGTSLVIHNDHDPKPVYYQLLGERGNIFKWEYQEQGPEWWKVKITKNRADEKEESVGQIAAKDIRKAEIFKKYGLDFCCGGKKTVKEACAEKGLDVTRIEQELQQADKNPSTRPLPYNEWSLDFLADYIVNTHHSYIRKTLPEIRGYAAKVAQVHGEHHPELAPIRSLVEHIAEELVPHMAKEEKVLFPYIKHLVQAQEHNEIITPSFGSVQYPISNMEMDHTVIAEDFEEIKKLSINYTIPQDACASYSLLYRMLEEFEDDLHTHIHLENNILFVKALELEKQLVK